jgi:hypothetical protein
MGKLAGHVMASLTGELTEEDANRIVDAMLGRMVGKNPFTTFFNNNLLTVHDLFPAIHDMYRSERGRAYARRIAYLADISNREVHSAQILLFLMEVCRHLAFPGPQLSADHDKLIWQALNDGLAAYFDGKLDQLQLVQLHLTMYGRFDGQLFGQGTFLEPKVRAEVAYIFGHRYRVLHRDEVSRRFFEMAAVAPTDTLVGKLARLKLEGRKPR